METLLVGVSDTYIINWKFFCGLKWRELSAGLDALESQLGKLSIVCRG